MANILLGIVVALLVAWSLPDLVRWRDWSWLHRVTQHKIPLPLVVAAFFLTCFALVQMLGHGIAGFLFGTVVLYLCLGPRDLEADVRGVLGLVDDGQAGRRAAPCKTCIRIPTRPCMPTGQRWFLQPDCRAGLA